MCCWEASHIARGIMTTESAPSPKVTYKGSTSQGIKVKISGERSKLNRARSGEYARDPSSVGAFVIALSGENSSYGAR